MADAKKLILENLESKSPYLDLGKYGLDGTEDELFKLLEGADHLEELVLSNQWWEYDEEKQRSIEKESQNPVRSNRLIQIPLYLPNSLQRLVIAGERRDTWKIQD